MRILALCSLLFLLETCGLVEAANQRRALLVAVDNYATETRFKSLRCEEHDTLEFQALLERIGYAGRVKPLIGAAANKQAIERELSRIAQDCQEGDTLLIALSGHGVSVNGESYFCPSNTAVRGQGKDRQFNPDTMISRTSMLDALETSRARVKLLIINACRNTPDLGEEQSAVGTLPGDALNELRIAPKDVANYKKTTAGHVVILHGCEPDKESFEDPNGLNFQEPTNERGHTLALYYLMQGMRCEAARSGNRATIKLNLVHGFMQSQVREHATSKLGKAQIPELMVYNREWEKLNSLPILDIGDCIEYPVIQAGDLGRDQKGKSFERQTFRGEFMSPLFFQQATFIDCRFEECMFGPGTYLHGVSFQDCTFKNADFRQAKGHNQAVLRGLTTGDPAGIE